MFICPCSAALSIEVAVLLIDYVLQKTEEANGLFFEDPQKLWPKVSKD